MSLQRACCCGDPTVCSVCSCATSYRVNGINLSYSFTINKVGAGPACTCRFREYDIQVNIVPSSRVIATKVAGGSCCYRARFDVTVSGYVNLRQYYFDSPTSAMYCPPPITWSQAYPFTRTTCACLTVACNSKVDVCGGPSRATALVHTIEIGDFIVDCNVDMLTGGDCDSCPTQGVFALRCLGGRFQYASDVGCLNNLQNRAFMGFYGRSQQFCGTGGPPNNPAGCFNGLDASIAEVGPFAVITEGECSEGQDDEDCIDPAAVADATLRTFSSSWAETLRTELQGPCRTVDWSGDITTGVCLDEYDVLQGGGGGYWTYV